MSKKWNEQEADVDAIRRILLSEWDPIGGGVPNDEYDGYIDRIGRQIRPCATVSELARFLGAIEKSSMGLLPRPEVNRRVAQSLLDIISRRPIAEKDYWDFLEFRVCSELAGGWWCDGFIPHEFDTERGRITGESWIAKGQRQYLWKFVLILKNRTRVREEIDWNSELPRNDVTGWLGFNPRKKHLTIDPARARPDASSVVVRDSGSKEDDETAFHR